MIYVEGSYSNTTKRPLGSESSGRASEENRSGEAIQYYAMHIMLSIFGVKLIRGLLVLVLEHLKLDAVENEVDTRLEYALRIAAVVPELGETKCNNSFPVECYFDVREPVMRSVKPSNLEPRALKKGPTFAFMISTIIG